MQAQFVDLLHDTTKIVRANTGLSAVIYTQMSDVEGELNGILTYDRKVLTGPHHTLPIIVLTSLHVRCEWHLSNAMQYMVEVEIGVLHYCHLCVETNTSRNMCPWSFASSSRVMPV